MNFFHALKLRFFPPEKRDPDFGRILYMYIPNDPVRSYWECSRWKFPATGTQVGISLPGDESGPSKAGREFYLGIASRFNKIMELARPELASAYKHWGDKDLPKDAFKALKLAGFDLNGIDKNPREWSISFENRGSKWFYITIPFRGDIAQEAVVDT